MQPINTESHRTNTIYKHILGLDVLRVSAASLVLVYHYLFWDWGRMGAFSQTLPNQRPGWSGLVHFGWVGVEVFFVLSGFVIAYSASSGHPSKFLRSRFLRLAPASWIAATLALACLAMLGQASIGRLLYLYGITVVFWPLNAIDGVWWTLGIEIDFYLLVYLLLHLRRGAMLETIMVRIGLASGFFWVAALVLQHLLGGHFSFARAGWAATLHNLVLHAEGNRELQLLLVQHGCLFALGVVLWNAMAFGVTRRRAIAALALVGCCLLEIVGQNGIISRAAQADLSAVSAALVWLFLMSLLVLAACFNGAIERAVGLRGARYLRFAGLLTYPLYLTHHILAVSLMTLLLPRVGPNAGLIVVVVMAYGVAALISGFWEPWLRGRLSALLPARSVTVDPPSQAPRAEDVLNGSKAVLF